MVLLGTVLGGNRPPKPRNFKNPRPLQCMSLEGGGQELSGLEYMYCLTSQSSQLKY